MIAYEILGPHGDYYQDFNTPGDGILMIKCMVGSGVVN
jgi:hypothetical protein